MKATTNRAEKWLLGLVIVLCGLIYHELIFWGLDSIGKIHVTRFFFNLSGVSPQFHYLLAAGLFFIRRKDIVQAYKGSGTPWQAMFFLVPGGTLLLWGHYVSATDIVYISFLLIGLGSASFLAGKRLVRAILLPVLILVLAIPLPAVLFNQIVFPFQFWTAQHSAWLLNLVGMPASAVGDYIYLAGKSVRVVETCTALGFIKWLTIYALAYVYIFPVTRLHSFLLILSAPFIAYGVNLLRAFSLILNPGLEVLTIHTAQGIIFFLIGFSLLYVLDSILLRYLGKNEEADRGRAVDSSCDMSAVPENKRLLVLASFLAFLFVMSIGLPPWEPLSAEPVSEIALADEIGDWKFADTPLMKRLFIGSVRYSAHLYRYYTRNDEYVALFIGYDNRRRRDRSFLSDKNGYQGEVGVVEEHTLVDPDVNGRQIESIVSLTDHGRILAWHWYEGAAGVPEEILRAFLALDQSPFRRTEGAFVVRLATVILPGKNGRLQANNRLRDFLENMGKYETR